MRGHCLRWNGACISSPDADASFILQEFTAWFMQITRSVQQNSSTFSADFLILILAFFSWTSPLWLHCSRWHCAGNGPLVNLSARRRAPGPRRGATPPLSGGAFPSFARRDEKGSWPLVATHHARNRRIWSRGTLRARLFVVFSPPSPDSGTSTVSQRPNAVKFNDTEWDESLCCLPHSRTRTRKITFVAFDIESADTSV